MVGWKVTKFPMSYLKPQVRFFLNFASLFSVMREFFCTSLAETLYDLDKWNPSKCKIPNLCLDRLSFCWKYMEFQLKNHRGFMSQSTKDGTKTRRKTDFLFQKCQHFVGFWPEHPKFSNSTLIGSFCAKYKTFDQKNPRGVIFHDTDKWCKIRKNYWLMVWKMTRGT